MADHRMQLVGMRARRPAANLWNLVVNFGQRDLKTKFKGTALGWLWSLAVPLATLAIYSVVFAVIFRADPPDMGGGHRGVFVLWLFCGLTAWRFFSTTITAGINALVGTGPLLQKVYFPAYAPVLGATLATGTQSLIEVAILAVALAAFANLGFTWLLIPIWAALLLGFTACLATGIAVLNVYYRDLAHLVSIALQLWFYLTPIIYPLRMVPENWAGLPLRGMLAANPFTQFVELFRALIYGLSSGSWQMWLSAIAWTGVAALFAWAVLRWRGADLGEHA